MIEWWQFCVAISAALILIVGIGVLVANWLWNDAQKASK